MYRSDGGYIQHRQGYSDIVSIFITEMMMGRESMFRYWLCLLPYLGRWETEWVVLATSLTSLRIGMRVVELDEGINKTFSLEMGGSK